MGGQQRAIGVVCHELGNAYYGGILHGVAEVAGRAGVPVIALKGALADLSAPLWAADHVAGWVVVHPHQSDLPALQALCAAGRPVVTVGTTLPGAPCSFIHVDHHAGMLLSVAHLVEHGHTRIACVDHGPASWMRRLVDGYRDALAAHGIPFDPELLLTPERIPVEPEHSGNEIYTRRGELAARHLLAAGLPCTALVAGPDLAALAAMRVLQAGGRRVPEDVAVIGFDDIGEAQSSTPTLTTVRQRFDDLGRAAAAQVLAEVGGAPPRPVALPITLLRRASCGCGSIGELLAEPELAPLVGAGWEEHLARLLVQAVRYPLPLEPGVAPAEVWPGVARLAEAAGAIAAGRPLPEPAAVAAAWAQAVALTDNVEALELCLSLLAAAVARRAGAGAAATGDGFRFLQRELIRARAAASDGARAYVSRLLEANHAVAVRLPASADDEARSLSWLAGTGVRWGCLALWDEAGRLEIAGAYRQGGPAPELPRRLTGAAFPPEALVAAGAPGEEVTLVLPVQTGRRAWGVLALAVPAQQQVLLSANSFDTPLALLAGRLGREAYVRELMAQRETLREAGERERMLAQTIQELGCPVIPLLEGVLLVPLVGGVDSQRAQQIIATVLEAVSREQAQVVLLDLTAVAVVDTQVANALIGMARATTLLGARVVLVGIRPEIAQSIVGLGIDLGQIATSATLASALRALPGRRA
jgi:DNA-binding LacI/PurR family transcriptional regulator/anti-anti-sigma regulatory factor